MPASPPADHDQPSDSNVSLAVTRVTTPGGRGSITTSQSSSRRSNLRRARRQVSMPLIEPSQLLRAMSALTRRAPSAAAVTHYVDRGQFMGA